MVGPAYLFHRCLLPPLLRGARRAVRSAPALRPQVLLGALPACCPPLQRRSPQVPGLRAFQHLLTVLRSGMEESSLHPAPAVVILCKEVVCQVRLRCGIAILENPDLT